MTQSAALEVVKPRSPVKWMQEYLDQRMESLSKWAQGRIDPAALVRFGLYEFQTNKQLQECTPQSIFFALIACAQTGLEPGGVKGEAFIVPFGKQAQFMVGYRGYYTLADRSPAIRSLTAHVVYENDDFDFDYGTASFVRHRPALSDRGDIRGAYAFIKLANGEFDIEWMNMDDLKKVRKAAKRGSNESPAWQAWPDQMYRKTPIRRLGKRLPVSGEFSQAMRLDELSGVDDQAYRQALGVEAEVFDEGEETTEEEAKPTLGASATKERIRAQKAKLDKTKNGADSATEEQQ